MVNKKFLIEILEEAGYTVSSKSNWQGRKEQLTALVDAFKQQSEHKTARSYVNALYTRNGIELTKDALSSVMNRISCLIRHYGLDGFKKQKKTSSVSLIDKIKKSIGKLNRKELKALYNYIEGLL